VPAIQIEHRPARLGLWRLLELWPVVVWQIVAGVTLGSGLLSASAAAAGGCGCTECPAARWHVTETKNFRVLNYAAHPVSHDAGAACEALRAQLVEQWGCQADAIWAPKCDVVLHPNSESYLREVGQGGRPTVASSLVDRQRGKIALRRIDIREEHSPWQTTALGHELTHVVLADRFAARPLPRWIDEGTAILADSPKKQVRHWQEVKSAMAVGRHFRALELVSLVDYPAQHRWGTFYGQSAALVEFLVARSGHATFLTFVEQALDQGYETALRQTYQLSMAELERDWHAHLAAASGPSAAQVSVQEDHAPSVPKTTTQATASPPVPKAWTVLPVGMPRS